MKPAEKIEFEHECTAQNPLSFLSCSTIKTTNLLDPSTQWVSRFDLKKMLSYLVNYFYVDIDATSMTWKNLITFSGCEDVEVCNYVHEHESSSCFCGNLESDEMKLYFLFVISNDNKKLECIKCTNVNKYRVKQTDT